MSNQGRNSTNSRGRGARQNSWPRPYRGNFHGASRAPVDTDRERADNAELVRQNKDLNTEIGQLKEQVSKEADKYRSENNLVEFLKSELSELGSQHKRTIEGYNEGWERLTNEKKELEEALKKALKSSSSEEHDLLEVNHEKALKELDAVQDRCANLESTNLAQTSQIKHAEQACQDRESELNERTAENVQLKKQIDQQDQKITKLYAQLETKTEETVTLRQEVAGLQQPHADEQAAVNNLIDEVASQVGKWQSDFEMSLAAVEAQGPSNDIKQSEPQPGKVSEAVISQDNALNDDEISAASMEVYSKLVRRSKARNKAHLEGCIRICNHLNVSPGKLRRALEKQDPDYDHDLDAEELLAKLKRLQSEGAATMQSARGILKNAGITEATLRALPGRLHEDELQDVADTILSKWHAKGASASHTGSRGAGSHPQPTQYSSADAETQTDASPESSRATIQTDPMGSKTYVDTGVQHISDSADLGVQSDLITVEYSHNFDDYVGTGDYVDAMDSAYVQYAEEAINVDSGVEKRPDYLDSTVQTDPDDVIDSDNVLDYTNTGTQTDPSNEDNSEDVPNHINVGVQTNPDNVDDIANVPSYINKGTQTERRLPPNRLILISLFFLFLLLCGGFLAWAISYQLDALQERAMWLDANDMSRRATIYFIDASAHGRRLGWIWRPSALNHIEKPYHYAESMVGFGVHVQ